ncbi:hypothetical protein PHET_06858 [Paragonimus heterotremus]|uniref:Uncharacterized protein n=1 Tax=Paragonimus heterotremus TaxID=100268 RepID=A0A8J4SNH0_9TREM|nr:hypothetical protein PHET_06858 [Paragonimus heterotremus]
MDVAQKWLPRSNRSNARKILHFHVKKRTLHPANEIGVSKYDAALMKTKGRTPYIWNRSAPALLPLSKQITQWPLAAQYAQLLDGVARKRKIVRVMLLRLQN